MARVRHEHQMRVNMSTIQEIKYAVGRLWPEELRVFRAWFAEFDASEWDRQLAEDLTAGRLEKFADEACQDLREGRCTNL